MALLKLQRKPGDGPLLVLGAGAIAAELALIGYMIVVGVPFGSPAPRAPVAKQQNGRPVADLPPVVLPPSDPAALRILTSSEAEAFNAAIPISTLANPSARPFDLTNALSKVANRDMTESVDCLTAAVYYEAASESDDGQRAVAQVVLNRLRHPIFPHTVCGVVYQGHERRTGCQFSFTCDGSLARVPIPQAWIRARAIAQEALSGHVYAPVGWATHYHTYQVAPYWATSLVKLAQVGAHIFYRWQGHWGGPQAFSAAYTGGEAIAPDALPMIPDPMTGPPVLISHLDRPVLTNVGGSAEPASGESQVLAPGQSPVRQIELAERPVLGTTQEANAPARGGESAPRPSPPAPTVQSKTDRR